MVSAVRPQRQANTHVAERSRAYFSFGRWILLRLIVGSNCLVASAAPASWFFGGDVRKPLSADMMASREGYTLISVGSGHGILRAADGTIAAVQRIDDDSGTESNSDTTSRSRATCPDTSGDESCANWCRAVAPTELVASADLQRNACSTSNAVSWNCSCYSASPATMLATCVSPCRQPSATQAQPASTNGGTSFAGDSSANRYFLYDVRFGGSFAAQVNALFIAMRIVLGLNEGASKACNAGRTCQKWALVLPPWCAVVHWYSETELVPWSNLFQVEALAKEVPMIEFSEFNTRVKKSNSVDVAIIPTMSKEQGSGVRGEFNGWANQLGSCENNGQTLPQMNQFKSGTSMVYSGYCNGDIMARQAKCGLLRRMSRDALQDMLSSVPQSTESILLKHLDALPFPPPSGKTREMQLALRPAERLEKAAGVFIKRVLGEIPFIGVHLRRNEFVKEHPLSTPSPEAAAARINTLMRATGIDIVFVATDGRPEFCDTLRKNVKAPLYYFSADDGAVVPDHKGEEAVMLLHILGRAKHFIGTSHSHFSDAVRRERKRQKRSEESNEVFCDGLTRDAHKQTCKALA